MTDKTGDVTVLDRSVRYSLTEVCRVCGSDKEWVIELVEEGILQPAGESRDQWRFTGGSLHKAMRARRLQRDLDLNLAGVALTLELLDEIEALRSRLRRLEPAPD